MHREAAQKQQLTEEFEQVAVAVCFSSLDNISAMDQRPTSLCACVGLFFSPQAQRTVADLQAQLDLLKDSTEAQPADTEDVAQLKVRQSVTCSNCISVDS